jgi:rod shape determining protein RodA
MSPATSLIGIGLVIVATIGIGLFGLRISRTTSDFYVASRVVTPRWNASAISGEYLSAASFLGVAGLVLVNGADMLWFSVGYTVGYLMLLVLVAAPAAGIQVLKPYQEERLTAFLHPTDNPKDQGYQINQSLTAIGAGGKTGRGGEATQTKLDFLPEHHTDFVFSVVGEEFGFMGAAVILSLFALLIWRSLRILTMSKNLYGTLVAGGITAMLMFQVFVNVGMSVGIMPITGIPLPLVSYGGSSVITTFVAVGLLQSIHARAREVAAAKGRDLAL